MLPFTVSQLFAHKPTGNGYLCIYCKCCKLQHTKEVGLPDDRPEVKEFLLRGQANCYHILQSSYSMVVCALKAKIAYVEHTVQHLAGPYDLPRAAVVNLEPKYTIA